jgi:peptidoglycan/LPS O-acetylase OafA/YrhL
LSEIAFAVCFFIILNRWVRAEEEGRFTQRWAEAFASIGLFSYSLYLIHHPIIAILHQWMPLGPRPSILATLARIVVYVPICIAVAYGFFMAVERHFLKYQKGQFVNWVRRGFLPRRKVAAATATAMPPQGGS